jgi:hypothetical protein
MHFRRVVYVRLCDKLNWVACDHGHGGCGMHKAMFVLILTLGILVPEISQTK